MSVTVRQEADAQTQPSYDVAHVIAQLRAALPDLAARYDVQSLWLFGSYVRHEQRSDSDLDVLVEFGPHGPTLFGFVALQDELSDLLGIKVDLVEKKGLRPSIGQAILREAIPL
ncbi:MAG: nucleotidyltransferase family protein [Anaerolineae bacterium]